MSSRLASTHGVMALVAWLTLFGCVQIETFFFQNRSIAEYRWQEAAPELDGDLSEPHPSLVPEAERSEGLVTLSDGTSMHWVFAHHAMPLATVVFHHGNGPHLGRFWDRVERLWQIGFSVLIYDYPGFGRSSGSPSEAGLYLAARAATAHVITLADVDAAHLIHYGQSMGVAPAFNVAAEGVRGLAPAPMALVSEDGWCSMQAMIEDGAFLDLPRELITHLALDSCARAAELDEVPVLLLHGARDRTVSIRQARLLEAAASGPVALEIVQGATHSTVPITAPEYDTWLADLARGALPATSD